MVPQLRTGPKRLRHYFSADLLTTDLPWDRTEKALCMIEIPGPIQAGEIWDMFGYIYVQNPDTDGRNYFLRSEIWATTQPGDVQDGVRAALNRQSGTLNVPRSSTGQGDRGGVWRRGIYVWPSAVFTPRYVKIFGAAGSTGEASGVVTAAAVGLRRWAQ